MGLLTHSSSNQKMKIPCATCTRTICNIKECSDFAQYERYLEKEKQSLRKKHFAFGLTAIFSMVSLYCLSEYTGFVGFVLDEFLA